MPRTLTIEIEPEFLHEIATARGDMDTRSEVVLVLPRPGGRVITTAKHFYPEGVFRIPSGGIHPGETPEQAFVREAMEETGLEVEPLARIAEMVLHCVAGDDCVDLTSYIILGSLTTDLPHPIDPAEQLSAYGEADAKELREIARRLSNLSGRWAGWGRFRAPAHEAAAEYLAR